MGISALRTTRLQLKKPGPDDLEALATQIGDWEVAKWLARAPHPYTLDDAREWIESDLQGALDFNVYRDGVLVGGVGLTKDEDGLFELGYWLGREHWGRGYATEAAQRLLDHARSELGISRIKSSHLLGNDDSANVLRKLGFREIGEGEIFCLAHKADRPCIKWLLA